MRWIRSSSAACADTPGFMVPHHSEPPPDRATEKDRCSSAYRLSTTLEYVLSDRAPPAPTVTLGRTQSSYLDQHLAADEVDGR